LFVIDGVWAWGPVGWDVTWAAEENYAKGIFFFIGALMYQVGAVMAYLEAVNNGSFSGHAMKRFLDGHDDDQKAMLDAHLHGFLHHANPLHHHSQTEDEEKQMAAIDPTEGWKTLNQRDRARPVYAMRKSNVPRRGGVDLGEDQDGVYEYTSWRWWPKWETLKTHHVQESATSPAQSSSSVLRYTLGAVWCRCLAFRASGQPMQPGTADTGFQRCWDRAVSSAPLSCSCRKRSTSGGSPRQVSSGGGLGSGR
jgi:hypothetical protein